MIHLRVQIMNNLQLILEANLLLQVQKKALIGGIVVAGAGTTVLSVIITLYFIRRRGKVTE